MWFLTEWLGNLFNVCGKAAFVPHDGNNAVHKGESNTKRKGGQLVNCNWACIEQESD